MPSDWSNIIIDSNNSNLSSTTIYYSKIKPTDTTNKYCHYVDNQIII